jgi:hypothetical protein
MRLLAMAIIFWCLSAGLMAFALAVAALQAVTR